MNNCRDCQHFTGLALSLPELGLDWGNCQWITDAREPGHLAATWDYEGYSSGLYVSADFGCIQWKGE